MKSSVMPAVPTEPTHTEQYLCDTLAVAQHEYAKRKDDIPKLAIMQESLEGLKNTRNGFSKLRVQLLRERATLLQEMEVLINKYAQMPKTHDQSALKKARDYFHRLIQSLETKQTHVFSFEELLSSRLRPMYESRELYETLRALQKHLEELNKLFKKAFIETPVFLTLQEDSYPRQINNVISDISSLSHFLESYFICMQRLDENRGDITRIETSISTREIHYAETYQCVHASIAKYAKQVKEIEEQLDFERARAAAEKIKENTQKKFSATSSTTPLSPSEGHSDECDRPDSPTAKSSVQLEVVAPTESPSATATLVVRRAPLADLTQQVQQVVDNTVRHFQLGQNPSQSPHKPALQ